MLAAVGSNLKPAKSYKNPKIFRLADFFAASRVTAKEFLGAARKLRWVKPPRLTWRVLRYAVGKKRRKNTV
jgi:hypothetical protein